MDMTCLKIEFDMMSPAYIKQLCSMDVFIGGISWCYIIPHIFGVYIWNSRNMVINEEERFVTPKTLALTIRRARKYYFTVLHEEETLICMDEILIK